MPLLLFWNEKEEMVVVRFFLFGRTASLLEHVSPNNPFRSRFDVRRSNSIWPFRFAMTSFKIIIIFLFSQARGSCCLIAITFQRHFWLWVLHDAFCSPWSEVLIGCLLFRLLLDDVIRRDSGLGLTSDLSTWNIFPSLPCWFSFLMAASPFSCPPPNWNGASQLKKVFSRMDQLRQSSGKLFW